MEASIYEKGERALISSIINQAIIDGCSMKRPRPPSLRNNKHDKIIVIKQKLNLIASVYLMKDYIKWIEINFCFEIPYFIISVIESIEIMTIGEEEDIAWSGREFFDADNYVYSYYCDLLDICPKYLSRKVFNYFSKIDDGIYKKFELIA